ncbi:MAG: hypothetical protein JNM17_09310 [Archangium sp.]|nr:hypothetical protein [Archangium sp.]
MKPKTPPERIEAPPKAPKENLPPPPPRLDRPLLSHLMSAKGPVSTVHFLVHPGMVELQREAQARGWNERGFTTLSVAWLELRWTADGWTTTHILSSNDVPCPVVNGTFHLQNCPAGTNVEFAIRVGLQCHAPHDTAFARDVGELWLNNDGKNFTQVTR